MTRLIDANALIDAAFYLMDRDELLDDVPQIIKDYCDAQPTIDAVPVIRCKDCKHRITANCERFGIKRYTQSDSFCSWAEPKEDPEA